MRTDEVDDKIDERARTRAEPLPEEKVVEGNDEHRREEAGSILRDSEERIAEASQADRPGDAAHEHRRSEDTA